MNTELIHSGGIQKLSSIQYVYLDFDGESTRYNGELLAIDKVELTDSLLTREEICALTADLNARYAHSGVVFVTDRPVGIEFSTIYIGYTDDLGGYRGLAETIDHGNRNASDNAFVLLNGSESVEQIADTIAHETDHIVFGLDHGGEGMERYAYTVVYSYQTYTGALSSALHLQYHGASSQYGSAEPIFTSTYYDKAENTAVNYGGRLYVSRGGVANNTTVNSAGGLNVLSGGVASNTTVNSSGTLFVDIGGVASNTTVKPGGTAGAGSAGYSGFTNAGTNTVSVGKIADGNVVSCTVNNLSFTGRLFLANGAVANNTIVNLFGHLHVLSGGAAYNTTVYYDMTLYNGGAAYGTIVSSGYRMAVSSGGTANNTTVQNGSLTIHSGGITNNTILNGGTYPNGNLYIASSGTANSVTVNFGGGLYISGGGVANNITLHSGGRAGGAGVYGFTNVGSNAVFISKIADGNVVCTISDLSFTGYLYLGSGGVANRTTVNSVGLMYISSGGTANSTTLNEASLHISNGGVASGTVINSGGKLYVSNGGAANATIVKNGYLTVYSGGTASGTILNGGVSPDGNLYVANGGVANNTTVNSGGILNVSSGGVANNTILSSGGRAGGANAFRNTGENVVSIGKIADGKVVCAIDALSFSGFLILGSGGIANRTIVNSYSYMNISNGGMANDTTLNGYLYASNGGAANNTTVNAGGYLRIEGGGVANDTIVNFNGGLFVSSGGTVNRATVNSAGWLEVYNGGQVNNLMVGSGGTLCVYSNGKLGGTVSLAGDLIAHESIDARQTDIVFVVDQRKTSDSSIIDNISNLRNVGTYSITVKASQEMGEYKLASGAAGFNQSITIGNGTIDYGTLTVNGAVVNGNDGKAYSLTVRDGTLLLTVARGVITHQTPVVTLGATGWTNQDLSVSASFNALAAKIEYSINAGRSWSIYTGTFTVASNSELRFRTTYATGEIYIDQYMVTNIDKVAPTISGISPNITVATNKEVTVTANFADDVGVATRQYKIDDGAWNDYGAGVTMTENGIVYFRAVDLAGNEAFAQYTVYNIDRIAPVLKGTITTRQNNNSVTLSWSPATDNTGVAGYFLQIGNKTYDVKGTTYIVGNMAIGDYTCRLQAYDAVGNKSEWSEEVSFRIQDFTAPVLAGAPVVSVKGFSAKISWMAASDNIGVAGYNVWLNGEKFETQDTWISFDALAPRSYSFQLEAYDAAGNSTWSTEKKFRIMPDGSDEGGPGAVSPVAKVAKYNATLKWTKAATFEKKVKIAGYEVRLNGEILNAKSASLSLKNLALGSYTYSVRALDSQGLYGAWSEEKTFLILDVTAPVVKNVQTTFAGYALTVSWIGEDKVGEIVSYTVKFDGVVRETLSGNVNSVLLQLSATDVGKHNVEIVAFDGFNYSKVSKKSVTVTDITNPDQVTGLSHTDVRDTKYTTTLTWNVATDNSGQISGYLIEIDGKTCKSTKNTLKVSKLSVGEHSYRVMAIDKAKNESMWSEAVSFTVYDVTAPNKVSAKGKVVDNSLAVSWQAVKDNVGVAFYEVWGGESANGMSLLAQLNADQFNFQFEDLQKGTYFYGVRAVDAAGNASVLKAAKALIKTDLVAVEVPLLGDEKNSPLGGLLA